MPTHENWRGDTSGTTWMHKSLIALFRKVNLRFVYVFVAVFVIPFYLLFSHKGYIAIYHYFRKRHGFGVWKSFRYTYLNNYRFGQIILDRFAAYAGQHFQFGIDGNDEFISLSKGDEGFVILSCHVGNYELAGYAHRSIGKRYNALVFSGEAATVMENRGRLLRANNIHMIPVNDDMSHVYEMNNALSNGEIVSIPGDRVFGSPRTIECSLLGAKVNLPFGPYAMAAHRNVPVIVIFVMKETAYRYQVYVKRLNTSDNDNLPTKKRAAVLAKNFAEELEVILKKYPEQWFNYYEFWNE